MQQRRTPGGQGPGARGGRDVRGAPRRTRATTRESGVRAESARGARSGSRVTGATRATGRGAATDATRSVNRPVAARRSGAAGATTRARAAQPRKITGRATVFCMLLIGLLLAYAYPVRVYLSQQAEIDQLERNQAAQSAHIKDLAGQVAKWKDDEYVKAQARGRLLFVPPGEKPYLVIDPKAAGNATAGGVSGPAGPGTGPWYDKLWSSIRTADEQGTP